MTHDASKGVLYRAATIADEFHFAAEDLRKAAHHFQRQLKEGLNHDGADIEQIPSFVTALPTGTETGTLMAADLGGTNFRVCSVELYGNSTYSSIQRKTRIPSEIMSTSTWHNLFHFLAVCILEFMLENLPIDVEKSRHEMSTKGEFSKTYRAKHFLHLGFTFSFNFTATSLNKGTLLKWTKGFDIPDAIGNDPCAMLQAELDMLHVPVQVTALVNDTVATLMARSYLSPDNTPTTLAAIFGTGTNGAYVEKISNIGKINLHRTVGEEDLSFMIINTEWGGFDSMLCVLPNTSYDEALDRASLNPKEQMFEKRISGMYLGEILRRIILSLHESGIFNGAFLAESPIWRPWTIDSFLLSAIATTGTDNAKTHKAHIRRTLGMKEISDASVQAIRTICNAIVLRAARLAAVAIGAVLIHSGCFYKARASEQIETASTTWGYSKNGGCGVACNLVTKSKELSPNCSDFVVDVGLDGSLAEHYPGFSELIRDGLTDIMEIGTLNSSRIRFGLAKDGSGLGAALIAMNAGGAEC